MEEQPLLAHQTSENSAIAQGGESPALDPPIHNISSSHDPMNDNPIPTPEEPSTGAWHGGLPANQNISARLDRVEASLDRLNAKVLGLSPNIMAQMTCMETRLRKRIDELYESITANMANAIRTSTEPSLETPQRGKRTNRINTDSRVDDMLKGILMDRSGQAPTSSKCRKRGRANACAPQTEGKPLAKKATVKRLFSPLKTGTKGGDTSQGRVLQIPPSIVVGFNPTSNMPIDDTDIAIIAYAWSVDESSTHPSEVLVDHDFVRGTRKVLQCIIPGAPLKSEVITMVSCMLTTQEHSIPGGTMRWWLPTQFSQYALESERTPQEVAGYYRDAFMGHVDYLLKVFIPMFDTDPDHWYLLVVDILRQELVYLDSMPLRARRAIRERKLRKVSIFLEEMLEDRAFYKSSNVLTPNVSNFKIVHPSNLPKQSNGVDCGVYVCRWMALAERWRQYDLGDVDESARVRLLVDVIRKPYNEKNKAVMERATEFVTGRGWWPAEDLTVPGRLPADILGE